MIWKKHCHLVGSMIIVKSEKTIWYHYVYMEDAKREFDLWDGIGEPYGWYKKTVCDD